MDVVERCPERESFCDRELERDGGPPPDIVGPLKGRLEKCIVAEDDHVLKELM